MTIIIHLPPPLQPEYIQLCKTLYTLLQYSPDEQQLFQAVGKVAQNLLLIGEQNARSVLAGSPFPPTASSPFDIPPKSLSSSSGFATDIVAAEVKGKPLLEQRKEVDNERRMGDDSPREKSQQNEVSLVNESETISVSENILPQPPSTSLGDPTTNIASDSTNQVTSTEEDSFRNALSSLELKSKPTNRYNIQAHNDSHSDTTTHVKSDSQTSIPPLQPTHVPNLLDPISDLVPNIRIENWNKTASQSDQDGSDNWYITFEQFISFVQAEPDLCQFFAEQNTMDLGSSSVDPVLTPYTRTVLALR